MLTKADVAEDVAGAVEAAERLIGGGDVVGRQLCYRCGHGGPSAQLLAPARTVALLGPSGRGQVDAREPPRARGGGPRDRRAP